MTERPSLRRTIEDIGAKAAPEAVGVAFHDAHHRTAFGYHSDRWFHAASTIKIPILLGVYGAIDSGRLEGRSRVHVRNRFLSTADGSPFRIDADRDANADVHAAIGRTLSVRELARHMIATSSNLATNVLIDLVGLDEIRSTLSRLGASGLELQRGVEDMAAYEKGIVNRVTADGLLQALRLIQDPEAFEESSRDEMLEILHAQEFRRGIPAGLPDEARVAHKTGEISTAAHDAGIVFLPDRQPYAVVILTEWAAAAGDRSETIAALSRAVYEHVTDGEDSHG